MPASSPTSRVRTLWALAVIAFAVAPSGLPAQDAAAAAPVRNARGEERIRAITEEQVAAWNRGDAKAFSASFADAGSFTNIRGTAFYGHQAFEDRHAEIFQTFFKGSHLAMTVDHIRFVRSDVAIVDLATELSQLAGVPPGISLAADGRIHTRLQEVFVQDAGRWQVASYHNVDVKAP